MMNQFYYFDGNIFPVNSTSISQAEQSKNFNPLEVCFLNAVYYTRKLTNEQYMKVADQIVKQLLSKYEMIDIGKIINEEFKDKIYHEAGITVLRGI